MLSLAGCDVSSGRLVCNVFSLQHETREEERKETMDKMIVRRMGQQTGEILHWNQERV